MTRDSFSYIDIIPWHRCYKVERSHDNNSVQKFYFVYNTTVPYVMR